VERGYRDEETTNEELVRVRAVGVHAREEEVVARSDHAVLVLFGTLVALTQGSAVAPFIYTIF